MTKMDQYKRMIAEHSRVQIVTAQTCKAMGLARGDSYAVMDIAVQDPFLMERYYQMRSKL